VHLAGCRVQRRQASNREFQIGEGGGAAFHLFGDRARRRRDDAVAAAAAADADCDVADDDCARRSARVQSAELRKRGGTKCARARGAPLITHRTSSDTKRPCVFTKPCELVTERSRSQTSA